MSRGWLRIYLGAAPGVGKTYAMLNEGTRRHDRGTDVVIGYVETHGRVHTAEQIGTLPVQPRRTVTYRGQVLEEMDLPGLVQRAPDVVLVDEFAHTNAPGVEHEKRWQDVGELLDAGINVITTLNLQHLESINDVVQTITGAVQRETVPDAIVRTAEQIELVDMTPEALRRRLAHGNVYPSDRIDAALSHFFRPGNLAALRELALLWLADRVDDEMTAYRERHGIAWAWETKERVVVSVTGSPSSERLIRRASRIAARSRAELVGVTVRRDDGLRVNGDDGLARSIALLEELGGRYEEVLGNDVAKALVTVARSENATQLVIGATRRSWRAELVSGSIVQRCVREAAGEIDVHIIGADVDEEPSAPRTLVRRRFSPLSRRRIVSALFLGLIAFPIVTELLLLNPGSQTLSLALSSYLLIVIAVAALGGLFPGLLAAAVAFLLSNWEFTPPIHTFTIADQRDVLALVSFFVAAITVSSLVDYAARRSADAVRAQRDARALARMASHISSGHEALREMIADLVRIFDLQGAELRQVGAGEALDNAAFGAIGEDAHEVPLDRDHVLVISGRQLDPESTELLRVVTSQLVAALDRQRLLVESAERTSLKQADELRSALLAAVSHDLRTPLASIKAAATALLSKSATFTPEQHNELLRSIDTESDRLGGLVEDLLDMSRIHEGSVELAISTVDLIETVESGISDAVTVAGAPHALVHRTGSEALEMDTDPVLIIRIVYNLVLNAIVHGGHEPVTVDVGSMTNGVAIRVIDQGAGIPTGSQDAVFRPFQREGDVGESKGVGLGLAIARGFADALGGELSVEETPGGGCTMCLVLPTPSPAVAEVSG
jgi:two-component system sensor histidine kinase KdpD